MKKILFVILMALVLFNFTGCEKKDENSDTNNTNTEEKTKLTNGYDLSLTENSSFDKLEFKYPKNAQISSVITSMVISLKKNDSEDDLFRVVFGSFYGTSTESAMEGYTKKGTKKYGNITWDVYEKNGEEFYAICYDYTVDVLGFIINGDVGNFKEDFLNNIKLNN